MILYLKQIKYLSRIIDDFIHYLVSIISDKFKPILGRSRVFICSTTYCKLSITLERKTPSLNNKSSLLKISIRNKKVISNLSPIKMHRNEITLHYGNVLF